VKCALCSREAAADLCAHHLRARDAVVAAYGYWKEAYGSLGWAEYLDRIKRNPRTGQWAKEAAGFLGDYGDKKGP
jgi:hypothetical protein